ncbi:MAG TPA: ATP-dependent DNA ligase [Actinomycetaceae bacterium]|nr:ATP-dependent DNA ligase [Actinomycetaceae bacterium]
MNFARLAEVSAAVAATQSRLEKRRLLAAALREAEEDEIDLVATYLSGRVRQRRTGVGWRSLADLPAPAEQATLTPTDVDAQLESVATLAGTGSQASRTAAVQALFGALTEPEQLFLRKLILGEVRQGALDSLLIEAIAEAAEVPVGTVRRAAMFSALTGPVARAALTGGAVALEEFRPAVLEPVRPMLASPAPDLAGALDKLRDDPATEVAADGKVDGIRVQVHKAGEEVAVFTRSLDDITERVPEIAEVVRALPAEELILDGEAIALDPSGRPRPFQETAARTGSHDAAGSTTPLTVYFFDLLHRDGQTLITAPAAERLAALEEVVPASSLVPRRVTADHAELDAFFHEILELGHEGLVLKDLTAPYDAGRRGAAWVKVKPRHTLDLVVLGVEWGSGRRQGKLSNIHLGARDDDGFVMLGKTFKGMTDEVLAWQTERFLELETHRDGHVVYVRPEQVVEIAFDGVQRSPRYPGGVALRFARVLRYREDKTAAEADTLDAVRALAAPNKP